MRNEIFNKFIYVLLYYTSGNECIQFTDFVDIHHSNRTNTAVSLSAFFLCKVEHLLFTSLYIDSRLYEDFKEAIASIEDKHNTLINANNEILREERILKERLKKFGYEIRGTELGNVQIFQRYSVMRLIRKVFRFSRRIRIRVGWFRRIRITRWYTRYRYLWVRIKKERIINIPETPWSDEIDKLKENGYTVHFFELTNQGYISESGESLNDIMTECEISETIRLKTAVMIPQYEQSLTKGLRLIGYELFSRPIAGDVPTSIPDLSLEETLAYRASWKGVELSELIESINLAPGETRNINIKQSFTSEKTQTQSVTTILDVTEKQSTTFTDFFEQTNRKTKETVTNKKWNAKAGGSFGAFKAGGSAGGSTKQTNKSFAQQIKRAANESSREMKRQSRVEINSKLTESSKLVIDESISSQIQNINDGVSLNLFFYRLDNVYQGGLHLEGLKLIYTRPVPLIKGTEIQDIRTFEFYEFEEFLEMITRDTILVLSASLSDIELELKEVEIRFSIVFKVFKKIFKEYFYNVPENVFIEYPEPIQRDDLLISGESIDATRVSGPLTRLMESIEKQKESYLKVREKLDTYESDDEVWWNEYREIFKPLAEIQMTIEKAAYKLLNSIEYGFVPISGAHLFSIPSNGAYLDCVVGSSSGLEQYSEDMRAQELNRRKAEIALMNAQTLKIHSQGIEALYEISNIKISNISFEDGEPMVLFNKELPKGNWIAEVNNVVYHGEVSGDRKSFKINNWESESGPITTIKIIDSSNGIFIRKVFQPVE